jgi:hypothetical protein
VAHYANHISALTIHNLVTSSWTTLNWKQQDPPKWQCLIPKDLKSSTVTLWYSQHTIWKSAEYADSNTLKVTDNLNQSSCQAYYNRSYRRA